MRTQITAKYSRFINNNINVNNRLHAAIQLPNITRKFLLVPFAKPKHTVF